jgi:hypothetical protein
VAQYLTELPSKQWLADSYTGHLKLPKWINNKVLGQTEKGRKEEDEKYG